MIDSLSLLIVLVFVAPSEGPHKLLPFYPRNPAVCLRVTFCCSCIARDTSSFLVVRVLKFVECIYASMNTDNAKLRGCKKTKYHQV